MSKTLLEVAPWTSDFGPHLCARCYGAGWMRQGAGGALVSCRTCDRALSATIARCWKVGSLWVGDPNPPTMAHAVPYTPEADQVIEAVKVLVKQGSGFLALHGRTGTGKSHASEAIARHMLNIKRPALFITAHELFEYLGAVERHDGDEADYSERFRWVAALPGLVIDELNLETNSTFVSRIRRMLLDARWRQALAGQTLTVLASNDSPDKWPDGAIGDRIMKAPVMCIFTGTKSYRQVRRERGIA